MTRGLRTSSSEAFVHAVAVEKVRINVANILECSQVVHDQLANGDVMAIGVLHDVVSPDAWRSATRST